MFISFFESEKGLPGCETSISTCLNLIRIRNTTACLDICPRTLSVPRSSHTLGKLFAGQVSVHIFAPNRGYCLFIVFLISNVLMIHSTPVISSYSESTLTEMYRSNAIAELKKGSKYQKCPGSNELNKTIILCANWLFTNSYPTRLMNNCQLFTSEQCAWGLSLKILRLLQE